MAITDELIRLLGDLQGRVLHSSRLTASLVVLHVPLHSQQLFSRLGHCTFWNTRARRGMIQRARQTKLQLKNMFAEK